MDKYPFDIYDFFAYLSAGFLLLFSFDYAFRLNWLVAEIPSLAQGVFWTLTAYVLGQINAHWSAWLFENRILHALGYPSTLLFKQSDRRSGVFSAYRAPLPKATAHLVRTKYEQMVGERGSAEDFFLFCFHCVKERCPQAYARLQTFQNLYGFSRNVAFAGIAVALMLAVGAYWNSRPGLYFLAVLAALSAYVLFLRYLKFSRHYSLEVFLSFATCASGLSVGTGK